MPKKKALHVYSEFQQNKLDLTEAYAIAKGMCEKTPDTNAQEKEHWNLQQTLLESAIANEILLCEGYAKNSDGDYVKTDDG